MKICYLGNATSIHTQKWAHAFAALGHQVTLLSFDFQEVEGVDCQPLESHSPGKYQQYFLEKKQLQRKLRSLSPDIIHAHWLPTYGFLAALTKAHPLIVSAWGGDVQRAPFQGPKKWFYRLVDQYVIARADCITTESLVLREILLEKFITRPEKIATFPWGVDTAVYSPSSLGEIQATKVGLGIENDADVVIYNREMRREYNTETLVRALPQILEGAPNTVFIFLGGYGEPEYISRMEQLGAELGVAHTMKIIPEVLSQREVGRLLHISDVFVSIPNQDSISCAVLEGMLCGVIPIVSNLPANRQLIAHEKNGYLVSGKSSQELAKVILEAVRNKRVLKRTMGQANHSWVMDNASWEFSLKTMLHLYNKLVLKHMTQEG